MGNNYDNSLDSRSSKITQNSFEDYILFENITNPDRISIFWSIYDKKNLKDQSLIKEDSNYIKTNFQGRCIYAPGIFGSSFSIMPEEANLNFIKRNFKRMNISVYDIKYFAPIVDRPHMHSLSKASVCSNYN